LDLIFILKGLAIGIGVSAAVGPVVIFCIRRTINKGFGGGLSSAFGALTADLIYAIIAGFSVSFAFVSDFLLENQFYIRLVGGIFLAVVGYKIFYTDTVKQVKEIRTKSNKKFIQDFLSTFALTASNPITIIAFMAIFSDLQMVDKTTPAIIVWSLIFYIFAGAAGWWILLVAIAAKLRKRIRLRNLWWTNKIAGVIITILAIGVILSAFFPDTMGSGVPH